MDEQAKASLATASESVKQFITLASAILGFEVTFAKDFLANLTITPRVIAGLSWVCLLLSVVAGVFVLLALTGNLASRYAFERDTVYKWNVRFFSGWQIGLFIAGLFFTLLAGAFTVFSMSSAVSDKHSAACACDVIVHLPSPQPIQITLPTAPAVPTSCPAPSKPPQHRKKHLSPPIQCR
jgi:hypothetical protein